MGEVFFIWNGNELLFAAKSFKAELLEAVPKLSARFVQEARVWLELGRHPNIVQAHGVEVMEGRPFLFLEFMPGGSLADRLAECPHGFPLEDLLRFAVNVCDGMTFAAARGLSAHRDLKPANCLLTEDSTVKVTDFGLAQLSVEQAPQMGRLDSDMDGSGTRLTVIGGILGTPAYMSPEQFADSRHADLRSDIYALGIMLYEMATGNPPFCAARLADFAALHQQSPVPVLDATRFGDACWKRLAKLMNKCLQKIPKSRPQTFSEVRDELADIHLMLTGSDVRQQQAASPSDARTHSNKAAAFGKLGLFERELAEADEAIRLERSYVNAWLNRGAALGGLSRHKEAIEAYDSALALGANNGVIWSNKGISLESLGKYEEALECHARAEALSPMLPMVWINKATTLGVLGRDAEAVGCLNRAIELNPYSVAAFVNLAFIYLRDQQFQTAADICQRLLRLDPKCARAWYVLGLAMAGLGSQKEAFMFLQTAEQLGFKVNWDLLVRRKTESSSDANT